MQLVLASASPRRHELLSWLGVPFTVIVTDAEESDDPAPAEVVTALPSCPLPLREHPTLRAWRKAHAVWSQDQAPVVLGADTTVVLDGDVLGKPDNATHAQAMLARLAGRTHTVYTGICVYNAPPHAVGGEASAATVPPLQLHLEASNVTLAPLDVNTIAAYVRTGEPLDKAGAYGIQGLGGQLVRQVEGSYTAVVGLPLPATWHMLSAAGVTGMEDPTAAYRNWLHHQGKEPLPCPPTLP